MKGITTLKSLYFYHSIAFGTSGTRKFGITMSILTWNDTWNKYLALKKSREMNDNRPTFRPPRCDWERQWKFFVSFFYIRKFPPSMIFILYFVIICHWRISDRHQTIRFRHTYICPFMNDFINLTTFERVFRPSKCELIHEILIHILYMQFHVW